MGFENGCGVERLRFAAVSLAAIVAFAPSVAGEDAGSAPSAEARAPTLGGPEGVHQHVETQAQRESGYAYTGSQRFAKPHFDWNARLKEDYRLGFGFMFYFLGQAATDTTSGREEAFGGIFRFLGGQIYHGNAKNGEFDIDMIGEGEFRKSAEIGWTPSFERHAKDRVQLTYWHKDTLTHEGVPSGEGRVVSASFEVLPGLLPFTRFAHSDGGAGVSAESALSAGLEWSPGPHHALSLGGGWADPATADLHDEYVVEGSWLWQASPNLSLLTDVQLMLDPANNPAKDAVGVFGLRSIVMF